MNLALLDRDLFFLLTTMGINFLGTTYDAVAVPEGFALRMVGPTGALVSFEVTGTADLTIDKLKHELELAMYGNILGRSLNTDLNWSTNHE